MTNRPCDRCGRAGPWDTFDTGKAGSPLTVVRTVCPDCFTPLERDIVARADAMEADE